MVEKIIWSPRAINEFNEIFDFLNITSNLDIVLQFEIIINKHINLISLSPKSFPIVSMNARRVVAHKNITIYYDYIEDENQIQILSIFDNRQNPDKLKL